jgi:hypothetical protein
MEALRAYVQNLQDDWDDYTSAVAFSPRMRFTQVKNLAIQAGLVGREAGVSNRSSTRAPVPALLTPRPRGVVAPVQGIRSASTFSQPHPYDMDETMVADAEYASYDRASSELSGPTSDVGKTSWYENPKQDGLVQLCR